MGRCRYCERKGFFLSTDDNGLCAHCQPIVLPDIINRQRLIQRSLEPANKGATLRTRISKCDVVIAHCESLLEYERRGIPSVVPPPSQLLSEYREIRDRHIINEIQAFADKALNKVKVASTTKARTNALSSALVKIQEIGANLDDSEGIKPQTELLVGMIHQATFDGYVDAARKAEFKGNLKKAVDQYQEALFFLRNDDIPDEEQVTEIQRLEAKIAELKEKD